MGDKGGKTHSLRSAVASDSSELMLIISQPGSSGWFKPFLVVFVLTVVLLKKQ